ncbi:CLUMA_CG016327, isoform A [Clunio marinus]|uniref:CLUMA_CG016327, isoform A n=1 Tax=Clunio marinus TaxID=568069 RepID=A0A1J1IWR8_9DIPT|nr:CLUMA_CG016327, isoform A [Clunio marinus]
MSSNVLKLKQPIQMASVKARSVQLESLQSFFNNSPASSKIMNFRKNLYERAIGQHVYKSSSAHSDPCRYGDFEVKGRASDF